MVGPRLSLDQEQSTSSQSSFQGRLGYYDLGHDSNDSSSATLTSMMTIAKFPSLSDGDVHESQTFRSLRGSVSTSASQQQFSSIQSLTRLSEPRLTAQLDEDSEQQRCSTAGGSERLRRAAPRFNTTSISSGGHSVDKDSGDPVLHAIHEKRSTEIIL